MPRVGFNVRKKQILEMLDGEEMMAKSRKVIEEGLVDALIISYGLTVFVTMFYLEFLGYKYLHEPRRTVRIIELVLGALILLFGVYRVGKLLKG